MSVASPRSDALAARQSVRAQPVLGLVGLLFVVPIAAVFAVSAGAERSTLLLAPLITYALPLVAVVAFWWSGWPGTRWRPAWSGWVDTGLIAVGAVLLTGLGQIVAGRPDFTAIFDPSAGRGHVPTFPSTLPLGGAVFVAMLQISLVGEGWPLHRLHRIPAGLLAVAASWAVALVAYFTILRVQPPAGSGVIARDGPVHSADFGATLIMIAAWQVLLYVVWRGWPLSAIALRRRRLPLAHATVLAGGVLTYLVAHALIGLDAPHVAAGGGCFVAAALLFGILFENWVPRRFAERGSRATLLLGSTALAVLLAVALYAAAGAMRFSRTTTADWVEHASLNALSASIILHVAIGRRWPFAAPGSLHRRRSSWATSASESRTVPTSGSTMRTTEPVSRSS